MFGFLTRNKAPAQTRTEAPLSRPRPSVPATVQPAPQTGPVVTPRAGLVRDQAQYKITSQIGAGGTSMGNMLLHEGIKILGRHIGDIVIKTKGLLLVAETGVVEGNIVGQSCLIRGTVVGNVTADNLIIMGSAHIRGDVRYCNLRMEDGAEVDGALKNIKSFGEALALPWVEKVPALADASVQNVVPISAAAQQ